MKFPSETLGIYDLETYRAWGGRADSIVCEKQRFIEMELQDGTNFIL